MIEKIIEALENKELYKNPDLDIWMFSVKSGFSESEVALIIKTCHESNFMTFLNEFRIKKVVKLINNEIIFKNPGYYFYKSGFKSKHSFAKYFKNITNFTVQSYIQSLKESEKTGCSNEL